MAALTGSGWPPGPTSVRAAMSPSRGSASNTSAAVASAPGSHQESSSLNATYGVWARRTPALRAAAPALRASATTSTPGKPWAAASALPSADPLSTTITGGRSGSRVSMPSVRSSSPRRLRVATTTVTRLTGHAARAPGNTSPRPAPPRGWPAGPRPPPGPASGLPTHRSSLLPPMVTWCVGGGLLPGGCAAKRKPATWPDAGMRAQRRSGASCPNGRVQALGASAWTDPGVTSPTSSATERPPTSRPASAGAARMSGPGLVMAALAGTSRSHYLPLPGAWPRCE